MSVSEKEIVGWFDEVRKSKKETKLVELVRSKKLPADAVTKEGHTALMHAADCDFSLKCIKELIKLGSDVNHQDNVGMTALDNAFIIGNVETFAYLLSVGAKCDLKKASG